MGILNKTRVYLVGQMQYFNGAPWRQIAETRFKARGITVFNPYFHPFVNSAKEDSDATSQIKQLLAENKYDEASKIMKKIRAEDLRTVDISDFIFVYINPNVPTCGAYEEIFWANRMKKPIFFAVEGGKTCVPLWMFGAIPHKYMYDNLESAIRMVEDIDDGKVAIDSDRWRLLSEEYR